MQEKYTYDFFTQKLNTFEAMCMLSDGYKINLYEKLSWKYGRMIVMKKSYKK